MGVEILEYRKPLKKFIDYRVISSKADYLDYLEADRIALSRKTMSFKCKLKDLIFPDYIWRFQRLLRKMEYYKNTRNANRLDSVNYYLLKIRFLKLSLKLGFTIPENVFGPGLAIVHYGTIVVNANSKIGANCRIHAGTNIGESGGFAGAPQIGDNVYIAPGAKIFGNIFIASNTAIAANACVGKTFNEENMLLGGIPARVLKEIDIKQIIKHI
jgi:serine O-acetyltransferase